MLRLPNLRFALALALLPLASCKAGTAEPEPASKPALGLMGTIPIYWGEAAGFGDVVNGQGTAHWARGRLETRFALEPLDTLTEESLAPLGLLLLAQPRALGPAENVALDAWVRQGGRLLLFADPMLTGESRFAIGDRRRPQDVILLSPILNHWGLRLEFDPDGAGGFVLADAGGTEIPVNRPGVFSPGDGADCDLSAASALARCRIGRGEVVVLADAAVLDLYDPHPAAAQALDWLLDRAFESGEIAGQTR